MTLLQVARRRPDRRGDPARARRQPKPFRRRPSAPTASGRASHLERGTIAPMADRDFMPLDGWDHLELWVGNAKQAAYFYEHALGFTRVAYAGPETGVRDRASYLLEQGEIRLVVTSGAALRQRDRPLRRPPRRRREGHRAAGSGRAAGLSRRRLARRATSVVEPRLGRGRARPGRARHDRDLRRERAHLRQPRRLRRPFPPGLRRDLAERPPRLRASASSRSTTSSATSSSAG